MAGRTVSKLDDISEDVSPVDGKPAESSLTDAILKRLEVWGQKLGLERIKEVLESLGAPHLQLPVVLIAGTNGKGSTSALLAAIAKAAGYRTGLYTSPHLESVLERIRLDGVAIGDGELGALLERVLEASEDSGPPPTYFESLTAAALLHFEAQQVDLAVMEVGLGGRLDATNVCEPLLSLITPIAHDHQEHLGNTLALIAREKAGIMRRGRPTLAWLRGRPQVRKALEEEAARKSARLCDAGAGVRIRRLDASTIGLTTPSSRYRLESELRGRHQHGNIALAVRAAEALAETGFDRIDRQAIERGVASCRWPGRLETVVLPDGRQVLLDGAHNLAGARALVEALGDASVDETERWDLLYASLRGKRAQRVLPLLRKHTNRVTLTQPSSDRALPADELLSYLDDLPASASASVEVVVSPAAALDRALERSDGRLLVCGSLYLVGEVRGLLRERFGRPERADRVIIA